MIYYIWGPQASGKTTLAKQAANYCKENNAPEPMIIDDERDFNKVDHAFIRELQAREMADLKTILVSQEAPPCWLENRFIGKYQCFICKVENNKHSFDAATATSGDQ